jgi:hypothetical protein
MVRLITPKEGDVVFSAARYQLRPLDGVEFERAWPFAETENRFRHGRVPRSDRDTDDQGPRACAPGRTCA